MLSRGRKFLLSAAACTLATSLALVGNSAIASADPVSAAAGAAAGQTVASARATLDALDEQVGQLEEQYKQAQVVQEASAKRAAALQADVTAQTARVDALHKQAAGFARAAFQSAGVDQTTQLFVSGDPESFMKQISTASKVDENMNDLLVRYQSEQANLVDLKRAADAEAAKATEAVQAMAKATEQAKAKLADQQALLSQLSAEQRAAVEADTAVTTNAAAAAAAAPAGAASTSTMSGGTAAGQKAAAYAIAHVGSRYVWGAAGPSAFDCSGLMLAAYATAGISIEHSAIGLSRSYRPVARGDLQTGDLVFWYRPIHHVGMYVGNGMVVHARNPRVGVVMQSLDSYGAPYSGAVRVTG